MNATISNCPKCGHGVNAAATMCTYCGTALSSGDSSPQPDEKAPGTTAQSGAPPPLLPTGDSPPVSDMTEVSAGTPEVSEVQSDIEPPSQIQPEETRIDINEPDEAVAGAAAQISDADGQMDSQLIVKDSLAASDAEEAVKDQNQAPDLDAVSAELEKSDIKPKTSSGSEDVVDLAQSATQSAAEVIPLADRAAAKIAASDSPGLPEAPVSKVSKGDPSESESSGADGLGLVADDEFDLGHFLEPDASKLSIERAAEEKPDLVQEPTPIQPDNPDGEPEAIVLTADDMGQAGSQSTVADATEAGPAGESEIPLEPAAAATETGSSNPSTAPGETRAKTEVIRKQTETLAAVEPSGLETAAQDLDDAQKKQRVAQALKKKKLKLAQAQALMKKKQQLVQAQKQKKAAILKARALKKQKAAQAGIVKAHREVAAGSNSPKVDNSNMILQSGGANTKMLGLLKKYEGQAIGINYDNSADIKEAELVEANDEFFSVSVKDQKLNYSHPLKTILTIIEGEGGVGAGKTGEKAKFNAIIKVYPLAVL